MSVHPIRPNVLASIMADPEAVAPRAPFNPAAQGYRVAYRVGEPCRCPGCGRSQWLVGRITAECAFCSTALPVAG